MAIGVRHNHFAHEPCESHCPEHFNYGRKPAKQIFTHTSLSAANKQRQEMWGQKDTMFAAVELAGEMGEALNVVKKLERERLGMAGSRATLEDLADELGDVAICLDLLAQGFGINLEKATARKFNKTSRKMGFPVEMLEE